MIMEKFLIMLQLIRKIKEDYLKIKGKDFLMIYDYNKIYFKLYYYILYL